MCDKMFHIKFVCFIIHIIPTVIPLVVMKQKAECLLLAAAMLSYILWKNCLSIYCIYFEVLLPEKVSRPYINCC